MNQSKTLLFSIYVTGNYDANKLYNGVTLTNGCPMTELFTCEKLVYNLMDRNSIGYSQGCFMQSYVLTFFWA